MSRGTSRRSGPRDRPKLEATKRKMRGWNAFVDWLVPGLPAVQSLVWAVLYRHATDGVVTRSNALLAKDVNVSDKTVRRAITGLRKAGLLQVVRQGGMHVGASTYRLRVRNMKVSQPEPAADELAKREAALTMTAAAGTELAIEEASQPETSAGHRWVSMAVTAMTDITDNREARGPDGSPVPLEEALKGTLEARPQPTTQRAR
jgi:DNA-binding transcriptional regulator YhcF (GntR family)